MDLSSGLFMSSNDDDDDDDTSGVHISNSHGVPLEARACSAYNIPIGTNDTVSVAARSCATDVIPMDKHGATATVLPTIERARACATYNIPMDNQNVNKSQPSNNDKEEDVGSSSVLDKDTIASRGINPDITRDQVYDEIQAFMALPLAWQHEWRMLLTIVMFLTYIPVPISVDLHPGFLMKGMVYFPLVGGVVVGGLVATVYDFTHLALLLPPIIAAAFSTAFGWYLTGCLHEDGLGDSADGK